MNAPSNLPAQRREMAPIEVLKSTVARKADDFKMVLPSHITVDKFQRTIATAALSNPQLMNCDRQSLLVAAMKLAQDGLLPDGREAALVPFKSWNRESRETVWQVQAMPMAFGLRKKILQSGQVVSLETGVVYRAEMESGHFLYEIGIDPPIRHRPKLDLSAEEVADSEIVAAYSIARLKSENGDPYWSVEVMRRTEIDKVRQASQTGAVGRKTRDGKAIEPKGPWVEWYGEMARKTVLRRHSKVLPMSSDLIDTFDRDDAEEERARGAAHLLEAEEHKPLTLPTGDELDARGGATGETIDPETGEVLSTDSRGMTEVDEETARQLDAGQTIGEQLGDEIPEHDKGDSEQGGDATSSQESPEADHYGAKPASAAHGQSWFDGEKLRYAHLTAEHGIKWYLAPPREPEPEAQQEPEANQGGIVEAEEGEDDTPPYAAKVAELREAIGGAPNKTALKKAEDEYLRHCVSFPKEIGDELDAKIMAKRRELNAAAAQAEG